MKKYLIGFGLGLLISVSPAVLAATSSYCELPISEGSLAFIGSGSWAEYKARVVGYHIDSDDNCEYAVRIHPGLQYYVNEKYIFVKADNLVELPNQNKSCQQ